MIIDIIFKRKDISFNEVTPLLEICLTLLVALFGNFPLIFSFPRIAASAILSLFNTLCHCEPANFIKGILPSTAKYFFSNSNTINQIKKERNVLFV